MTGCRESQSSRNVPGEWRALIVHCSPAALKCLTLGYLPLYERSKYMYMYVRGVCERRIIALRVAGSSYGD